MLNSMELSLAGFPTLAGLEGETKSESSSQRGAKVLFFASLTLLTSYDWELISPEVLQKATLSPLEDRQTDLSEFDVAALFTKNLPLRKKQEAPRLAKLLLKLAHRYEISPSLILAIIETESGYRDRVVSKVGAVGLMQVKPSTAKEVAKRFSIGSYKSRNDLFDSGINMRVGVAYLSYLRDRFQSSPEYLAAYNAGPTYVSRALASGAHQSEVLGINYASKVHSKTLRYRSQKLEIAAVL